MVAALGPAWKRRLRLQNNVLNRQAWDTRDQLRIAIVTWIERTYHRRRRQHRFPRASCLVRVSPVPYTRNGRVLEVRRHLVVRAASSEPASTALPTRRPSPAPPSTASSLLTIIWHLLSDPYARYHDLGPD